MEEFPENIIANKKAPEDGETASAFNLITADMSNWMEEDELPWVEVEERKTPFYADKPDMMIEEFLEHCGVKHLRDLLDWVKQ